MREKRQHPRISTQELQADISIIAANSQQAITLCGGVVDMSYSGIKIKLLTAMPDIPAQSKVSIILTSSNLTTPMTIKGTVRHISGNNECGIALTKDKGDADAAKYLFECIRNIPNKISI